LSWCHPSIRQWERAPRLQRLCDLAKRRPSPSRAGWTIHEVSNGQNPSYRLNLDQIHFGIGAGFH
jgi:hypothetical protein